MIKMQLVMDDEKIKRENIHTVDSIRKTLDDYLIGKLGMIKADNGFYLGDGSSKDFSRFGIAFNTLRKTRWLADNVKTWLYYNSDASEDAEDFAVEDFGKYCTASGAPHL